MNGIRQGIRDREARLRDKADPACTLCHGTGQTHGYIGPGKMADYPCRCTGEPEVT